MYYLLYGILYLISLLPFFVLYALSDIVTFMMYHIIRYRRDVVMSNLRIAFPERTEQEHKSIAKKFYRNFNDTWLESIKLLSISKRELNKRMASTGTEIFQQLKESGQRSQIYMAHNFNWEWANVQTAQQVLVPFLGVYQPITNKAVDRLFRLIRQKGGTILLPANHMRTAMLPWRDKQYSLGLIADQNPGIPATAYWLNFFGKKAPFVKGPETFARYNNAAVIFCFVEKLKRGYYHIHFELVTDKPRETKEGETTIAFVRYIENAIRRQPDIYLWSHKRWRHEWKEEYASNTLE
jgi:KDO2-lipid IV(A) lauroyltransferase